MSGLSSSQVLMGIIDLQEAKRIRGHLGEKGIKLVLLGNPETCQTGSCGPTVEVWVEMDDLEVVKAFLAQERAKLFHGLNVDPALQGTVFDPEAETAQCPACGTVFSTRASECPDCGLGFGGGAAAE